MYVAGSVCSWNRLGNKHNSSQVGGISTGECKESVPRYQKDDQVDRLWDACLMCHMKGLTQLHVRVAKQTIVRCIAPGINYYLLLCFFLIRLCIYVYIYLYYKLSPILCCMKLPCLHIKWWRWSWRSKVAGKESRFCLVKIFLHYL